MITAGTIYAIMAHLTVGDEDAILTSTARPLASKVVSALNRGEFPNEFVDLKKLEELYPRLSAIVLRDAMGNVLADTNPNLAKQLPYTYELQTRTSYVPNTKMWVRVLTIHFSNKYGQTDGFLQLAFDITHDVTSLARLRQVMFVVGFAGTVVALLAGFLVSNRALRPIVRSWHQQQRFVGDASHELRTPLAIIQANLDVVLSHVDESVAENLEWISTARSEVGRVSKLTDDLLTLARADSNEKLISLDTVNLFDVVMGVYQTFSLLAQHHGIRILLERQEPKDEGVCLLQGDRERLHQLVAIILDNAIKYTPSGGSIRIGLTRRRNVIVLEIEDTGTGISKEELGRIFERFYRGDKARTRAKGGSGLGLSIAQWIVSAHRGKIRVSSIPGESTVFTVTFQALPASSKMQVNQFGQIAPL